jgi:hypothetical protein
MKHARKSRTLLTLALPVVLSSLSPYGQAAGAKGRFQDRGYCNSAVMDQIVHDGKSAIPVLISQITDARWIAEPVYDFWPRIRTGELAYFILEDLFLDDSWQKSTMPPLFPPQQCNEPSWACWERFRKTRTLKALQMTWIGFWKKNQGRIYWDEKARCFRLSNVKRDKRQAQRDRG